MKPCPFCGSENIDCFIIYNDIYKELHAVECIDCEARGPIRDYEHKAISNWNQRRGDHI